MPRRPGLNERAAAHPARASLWHVDTGWSLFAGPLARNAPHAHSVPVFLAGLYGSFRLRVAGSTWMTCRSAVIRAGTSYEFDMGGEPLGVLYLEPSMGGVDALSPLAADADEVGGALVGRRDASPLRRHYEQAGDAGMQTTVKDLIDRLRLRAHRNIDARIARSVGALGVAASERMSVQSAAAAAQLSPSRFQHLFTREVGVPFRRYRRWQRLRAAIREAVAGASLTEAAHAAGFADQAHFSRAFRDTFGAPPSAGL